MKKILFIALVVLFASCAKDDFNQIGESNKNVISAYVSEEVATKVSIQDATTSYQHVWNTSDSISVFDGTTNLKYTLSSEAGTTKGTFTGAALTQSAPYYAIYPCNSVATIASGVVTTTFPATQEYVADSYDKKAVAMIASVNNSTDPMPFKIASTFMRITLTPEANYTVKTVEITTNAGENIAGTGTITYDASNPTVAITEGVPTITVTFGAEGKALTAGTSYTFFVALPAVPISNGVSVAITGSDNKMAFKKSSGAKKIALERNVVYEMNAITEAPSITNLALANSAAVGLSATPQTANCYVVNAEGTYFIPVNVKGNGVSPTDYVIEKDIKNITNAVIVWNDDNSNKAVDAVSLYGKYMTFHATAKKGNALLAVKNSSDVIQWSWHIWNTDYVLGVGDVDFAYDSNTYTVMKRVLGAKTDTTAGLFYQGFRKDPFLPKGTTGITGKDFDYTVANPTVITRTSNDLTYSDGTDNFWSLNKTMLDPSPIGYVVSDAATHYAIKNQPTYEADVVNFYYKVKRSDDSVPCFYLPICGVINSYGNYTSGLNGGAYYAFFMSLTRSGAYHLHRLSMWAQGNPPSLQPNNWAMAHSGNVICLRVK